MTMSSPSPVKVLISNCSAKLNDILNLTDGSFASFLDDVGYSEWFDERDRFNVWCGSVGARSIGPDSLDSKLEKYEHLPPILSGILGYLHLVLRFVEESNQQGMQEDLTLSETTASIGTNELLSGVPLDESQSKPQSTAWRLRNLHQTVDSIMRCLDNIDVWFLDSESMSPVIKEALDTTVRQWGLQRSKEGSQQPNGDTPSMAQSYIFCPGNANLDPFHDLDHNFSSATRPDSTPSVRWAWAPPGYRSQDYFSSYPKRDMSPPSKGERSSPLSSAPQSPSPESQLQTAPSSSPPQLSQQSPTHSSTAAQTSPEVKDAASAPVALNNKDRKLATAKALLDLCYGRE